MLAVTAAADAFSLLEDAVLDLAETQTLINDNAHWHYLRPQSDPAQIDADFNATWYSQSMPGNAYDGEPFSTGLAPLSSGGVDGLGPPATHLGTQFTTFFYHAFDYFGDASAVSRLFLADAIIDDGAIFYLNGEEIGRFNMGEQADSFGTHAVGQGNEGQPRSFDLMNGLVYGRNVFALSLHNSSDISADVGFGFKLQVVEDRGNVLANDTSDLAPPDGLLRVTTINGQPIGSEPVTVATPHGSVTMRPDGTFRYVPAEDYHGTDLFTYVAADAEGESAPTTVTLHVSSLNDGPVAVDDAFTLAEDTTFVGEIVAAPQVLLPSGATWDYFDELNRDEDYPQDNAGRDWFRVDFDIITSDPQIGVWKTGEAPFAQGDILAFDEPRTPLLGMGTTNTTDLFRTTFVLGDAETRAEWLLVRSLFDDGGILYLNGSPIESWNMPAGPITPETLTTQTPWEEYRADLVPVAGLLRTGVNTIAFELHQGTIVSTDRGFDLELLLPSSSAVGVTLNDSDVEGSPLAATLVIPPEHGELVLEPSGRFTYTPDLDYFGEDSFTYTVTDLGNPAATSSPATVRLTITPVNDTLVAQDDYFETDEDVDFGGNFLDNDTSEDGPLHVTNVGAPSHGTVSHDAGGNFYYEPHENFYGVDSFTYTVQDAVLDTATVRVEITVRPVNDAPVIAALPTYSGREDQPLVIASLPHGPVGVLGENATWQRNESIAMGTPTAPASYPTDSTHPDAAWYDPEFSTANSTSPWKSAAGPFSAGHIFSHREVDATTLQNRGLNTVLFRTTFTITPEQAQAAPRAMLSALVDDGGVLYLNGREVLRINMPADEPIGPDTLAMSSAGEVAQPYSFDLAGLVVPGENVLAFELHQGPLSVYDIAEHIRITEIMYHPTEPTATEEAAGFEDDNDFEFIEIANLSDRHTIDLNNVAFTTGITFNFNGNSLEPNERGVVVANLDAFRARHGHMPRVLGVYGGSLSNSGERLVLQAPLRILADFTYGDANVNGWPEAPDGDGYSLVIADPNATEIQWGNPIQWRASTNINGSPGAADPGDASGPSSDDLAFGAALAIAFPGGLLEGASDVENDALSVVIVTPPTHGSLVAEADGSFRYAPDRNFFGVDTFAYTISDDALIDPRTSGPFVATIQVLPDSDSVTCEDLDWNRNGIIDGRDLVGIADRYGASVADGAEADFDGDGKIALGDLIRLKNAIGQSCSAPSAPAAVRAAAVDAALDGESDSPRRPISARDRRLAVAVESRSLTRRTVVDAAESSDRETPKAMTAISARRALRKLVADRADELI